MAGNKTDNGVHEVGTDDIRLSYQNDTLLPDVENYIKEQEKAFHEEKNRTKNISHRYLQSFTGLSSQRRV